MPTEDEDERAANERDIAKMRETVKAEKEAPEDDPEEEVEPAPEEPKEGDEIRPTRQQKKRERGESLVAAARRDAEEARRETAELRGRVDELSRRPIQQAPATTAADPLITERDQLRREYNSYTARVREAQSREGVTQADLDKLQEEAWELKERMDTNLIRREQAKNKPAAEAESRKAAENNAQMQLHARHGDVTRDARATAFFQANYKKLLASGSPDDWDTLDKAMDQTRTELRMQPRGGRPAPSDATKARLSGMARGGGGAGAEPQQKGIKVTKDIIKQANMSYPHLPKEKRLQAWIDNSSKHLEDA